MLNTDDAARAVVGTLAQPMLGIDVDPGDTGATPEAGDAVAEQLILWADHHGLPWLRRASGRPGHAHIIMKTPPCLRGELQFVVRKIAARQNVSAGLRSTLRLTSSPHRHDLPCPIQGRALTTADALPRAASRPAHSSRPTRRRSAADPKASTVTPSHSPAPATPPRTPGASPTSPAPKPARSARWRGDDGSGRRPPRSPQPNPISPSSKLGTASTARRQLKRPTSDVMRGAVIAGCPRSGKRTNAGRVDFDSGFTATTAAESHRIASLDRFRLNCKQHSTHAWQGQGREPTRSVACASAACVPRSTHLRRPSPRPKARSPYADGRSTHASTPRPADGLETSHTHPGHAPKTGHSEQRRHVEQRWPDSNDWLTLTAF